MENKSLVNWLFETKAFRVSPENKPFWYTSGTIGPYYINTHFLYGSEEKANLLLKEIDNIKEDKLKCPPYVYALVEKNYRDDPIFKGVIDNMLSFITNNISVKSIDYISGGERRDWFFSLMIAKLLGKPHITIYKDLSAVLTENAITKEISGLKGASVLHIADLITEASSYERAWIPAIEGLGGHILWSVVVVDRKQGGEQLLQKKGVKSFAMVSIDGSMFSQALESSLITHGQYEMLMKYSENPKESMKMFIHAYPEFLENSLNSDPKTIERAKLCIEKKFYE